MRLLKYLSEGREPIFDYDTADEDMKKMQNKIKAPYISVQKSALGGKERASIILRMSIDPKGDWQNNILHNSRYLMWHLDRDGTMELFSKGHTIKTKFRKQKAKSIDMFIKKVNDYISKVEKEMESQ